MLGICCFGGIILAVATLTEKKFWNSIYRQTNFIYGQDSQGRALGNKIKAVGKRFLGERFVEYTHSYSERLLWNSVFPKYLPKIQKAKAIEIGSAPGHFLLKLKQAFGYIPYGVEYSENGAETNRQVFIDNNISGENVIYEDFFSDKFHRQYREAFDIVISRGFVEHFTDLNDAIDKHLSLLKNGGYIIVDIPNLRGFNYLTTWLFHKEILPMHNLNIMEIEKFLRLFDKPSLIKLFCGYYGTFLLSLDRPTSSHLLKYAQRILFMIQRLINVFFCLILKNKGLESRFFSPRLIYIGIKKYSEAGCEIL